MPISANDYNKNQNFNFLTKWLHKFRYKHVLIEINSLKKDLDNRKLKVLDIGCGDSKLFGILNDKFEISYTGIELNEKFAKTAQKRFKNFNNFNIINGRVENYIDTFEDVVTPIQLDFNDIDSNQLTITFSNPSNGSASLNSSYLEYTPNENYFGSDSLTYVVNDGEFDSNSSKVVINIEAVNDPSSDFTSNKQLTVNALSGKIYDLTTNYLMVNPNNIEDSLTFSWNASEDIDGDNIKYKLIGYDQISFLTIDDWTEELSFSWKIGDIIALTDTVNTFSGFWGVIASDGEFIVESDMGLTNTLSINGSDLIPENINLSQNYPNPFKGSTIIPFDLPESRYVVINIIDVKGRKIRTLIDGNQSSGFNSVLWDGKNEDGDEVSSGVYFYQINVKSNSSNKSYIKTKKLIKLR